MLDVSVAASRFVAGVSAYPPTAVLEFSIGRRVLDTAARSRHGSRMSILDEFTLNEVGFLVRWGPAKERGDKPCQRKLCITATSREPIARLLHEWSLRDDCYFVKLDGEVLKNGMVRGRCFLTDEAEVGKLWQKWKVTESLLTTIQDDDFTDTHRK